MRADCGLAERHQSSIRAPNRCRLESLCAGWLRQPPHPLRPLGCYVPEGTRYRRTDARHLRCRNPCPPLPSVTPCGSASAQSSPSLRYGAEPFIWIARLSLGPTTSRSARISSGPKLSLSAGPVVQKRQELFGPESLSRREGSSYRRSRDLDGCTPCRDLLTYSGHSPATFR